MKGTAMEVKYAMLARFPYHRFGSDGSVWSRHKNRWGTLEVWKQLKGSINRNGYVVFNIPDKGGRSVPNYGHRLVLEAFSGLPSPGMQCCHCDGNPANNALGNLRWDTPEGNSADMVKHGTRRSGERAPSRKLSQEQVNSIRRQRASGARLKELAREFGVDQSCISKICRGTHWKEVAHAS
jgi:hypothetical protein